MTEMTKLAGLVRMAESWRAKRLAEETFGERVRALREELGLSQPQLAERFPSSSRGPRTGQWISHIETGKQEISLQDLPFFETALGVDMRWLITGENAGVDEFTARVAELGKRLDARGRRAVMRTIMGEIEEAEAAAPR